MRRRAALVFVCVLALVATVAAGQSLQVTPLTRDGRVLVSYRLADAFNEQVRSAIHSGLAITFVYDVELKRSSSLWLDATIGEARVSASVRYDNLTRRYHLTRTLDGRIEGADTVEKEDDVYKRLTEFEKLALFSSSGLEPNSEYYLRVRAHITPRNASFVWPWKSHDVSGLAKFTFIP
jgi:hypothetical protein